MSGNNRHEFSAKKSFFLLVSVFLFMSAVVSILFYFGMTDEIDAGGVVFVLLYAAGILALTRYLLSKVSEPRIANAITLIFGILELVTAVMALLRR
jgi:uncharacterized protein YhhL (DUF1145 family)